METDVQKQFIEAIKNNQPEEVERLIKEGADVDANCGEALDIATVEIEIVHHDDHRIV